MGHLIIQNRLVCDKYGANKYKYPASVDTCDCPEDI